MTLLLQRSVTFQATLFVLAPADGLNLSNKSLIHDWYTLKLVIVLPQNLMPMKDVTVFDINRDRLTLFEEKFGVRTAGSLPDAVEEAELVGS